MSPATVVTLVGCSCVFLWLFVLKSLCLIRQLLSLIHICTRCSCYCHPRDFIIIIILIIFTISIGIIISIIINSSRSSSSSIIIVIIIVTASGNHNNLLYVFKDGLQSVMM